MLLHFCINYEILWGIFTVSWLFFKFSLTKCKGFELILFLFFFFAFKQRKGCLLYRNLNILLKCNLFDDKSIFKILRHESNKKEIVISSQLAIITEKWKYLGADSSFWLKNLNQRSHILQMVLNRNRSNLKAIDLCKIVCNNCILIIRVEQIVLHKLIARFVISLKGFLVFFLSNYCLIESIDLTVNDIK